MISPLFVCLIIVKVSGLPIIEKKADLKWGADAEYVRYKKVTPMLVPFTCGDRIDDEKQEQYK
jgi:steroid 5-alpha reductase family enzyme